MEPDLYGTWIRESMKRKLKLKQQPLDIKKKVILWTRFQMQFIWQCVDNTYFCSIPGFGALGAPAAFLADQLEKRQSAISSNLSTKTLVNMQRSRRRTSITTPPWNTMYPIIYTARNSRICGQKLWQSCMTCGICNCGSKERASLFYINSNNCTFYFTHTLCIICNFNLKIIFVLLFALYIFTHYV